MLTNEAGDALDAIARAEGLDALRDALSGYLAKRSVHMFSSALILGEGPDQTIGWVHSASDEFFAFYRESGFEAADYGVRMRAEEGRTRPYFVGTAFEDRLTDLREDERDFYRATAEWGNRSSVVLPTFVATPAGRRPCGFGLWSGEEAGPFEALTQEHGAEMALVMFSAQASLLPPLLRRASGHDLLTVRERECLAFTAAGLRADAIADRLCLAKVTVHVHLASARRKLGATTLPEAVAKAVRSGLIAP